jgi:hypothetical protein
MEVPSALEEVAAVVRGFLPPHPVAQLVKKLKFEDPGECNVPEGITSSKYLVTVRASCWDCHKVLNRGCVFGFWDCRGEPWDPHGENELLCDACMEAHWTSEGFARIGLIDRNTFFLVIWRNGSGRELLQPLDTDDVEGLRRLRGAMLTPGWRNLAAPVIAGADPWAAHR